MNYQEKIKHIQTHFPMSVLLKKLKILPLNFNINHRFPCPIHQGSNPTSCHINNDNCIHCWSCCKDFTIIEVYQHIRNINDTNETIKRINNFMKKNEFHTLIQQNNEINKTTMIKKQTYQIFKPKPTMSESEINAKKKQLFKKTSPLFNKIRDYYHYLLISNLNNESQVGLEYLINKRKLTLETIKEFNLGYSPLTNKPLSFRLVNYAKKYNIDISKLLEYGLIKEKTNKQNKQYFHDVFYGSIIIPIENGFSKTFHFYQNHFRETSYFKPKYQSLTNFSQTAIFHFSYRFFESLPYIKKTKTIIIHEGFFDVIICWQNNIKNVVGLICITQLLSQSQIVILQKDKIKVIIALDNDETGRKRSQSLSKQLEENQIAYEIRQILPPYHHCKDADELLRQYGIEAYQKCYLNSYLSYQQSENDLLVNLAIHIFGNDKVEIIK